MQTIECIQGTPEWHAIRAKHFTASEAPAMMGASKYMTRSELLRQKATGDAPEVSDAQQRLFDKGHAAEAAARPVIEELIGEELYPVTGVEGDLLASFDGLTMMQDTIYEHKLWNEELAAQVRAKELDPHYYWQLEQQFLVSGAERCIFVCSDGTETNLVWMEYRPVPGRAKQLLAGWEQFKADLAAYQPTEAKPEAVGRAPETLPALRIEVTGMVTASNLEAFKAHALAVFQGINTSLQTDADFADAEKTVKWCKDVEDRLDAAKQHALSQTASIDELFRAIDAIKEEARAKRLELDKLVKNRKEAIRDEIRQKAVEAFAAHVAAINKRLVKVRLPEIRTDFAGVMKGKKTVASLQGAADDELARAKIEANAITEVIETNLATLRETASEYAFLFADVQQLVMKSHEDLVNVIKARIADHKAAEERKLEAERERTRRETEARFARVEPDPAPEPVAAQPIPMQAQKPAEREPYTASFDREGHITVHLPGVDHGMHVKHARKLLASLQNALNMANAA